MGPGELLSGQASREANRHPWGYGIAEKAMCRAVIVRRGIEPKGDIIPRETVQTSACWVVIRKSFNLQQEEKQWNVRKDVCSLRRKLWGLRRVA